MAAGFLGAWREIIRADRNKISLCLKLACAFMGVPLD